MPRQFKFLSHETEAVRRGDFLSQPFDVRMMKLNDTPTLSTDKIVVSSVDKGAIVLRLCSEMLRLGNPHSAEQIHRSIHGPQRDPVPFSGELHVEVLGCDRAALPKCVQNQISLFTAFQSMPSEMRV